MKNTRSRGYLGLRLPQEVQIRRVQLVIQEELTPCQREILNAYYFRKMTLEEIAQERGIHKSTVCRTLKRAEENLRKYLRY